jgi:Ca-activated chloride channel homolog
MKVKKILNVLWIHENIRITSVINQMAMKKISLALLVLCVFANFSTIPSRIITGNVTSAEDGSPLPGVNVSLKGTSNGTATDAQGKYQITVPDNGGVLVFAFVGMKTQEVKIESKSVIDVTLEVDVTSLQEVVVTGYGIQTRKDVTQSVAVKRGTRRAKSEQAPQSYFDDSSFRYGDTHYEEPNTEEYAAISENTFKDAVQNPLSTFSIDVDKASYSNVRRFINQGVRPPADAVRIEEMINYFKYDYNQPKGEHPFAVYTEVSTAPWNEKHKLVHIGLQGKDIATESLPPSNLVFLIDVSGSMDQPNKLPLVKQSFAMLVDQLRQQDRVAIVVYAGASGVVLEPTSGSEKRKILNALDRLQAGGSTAGAAGLRLAYSLAEEHFKEGGNNRVILATDGDFNVGESSNEAMEKLIVEKRKLGVLPCWDSVWVTTRIQKWKS